MVPSTVAELGHRTYAIILHLILSFAVQVPNVHDTIRRIHVQYASAPRLSTLAHLNVFRVASHGRDVGKAIHALLLCRLRSQSKLAENKGTSDAVNLLHRTHGDRGTGWWKVSVSVAAPCGSQQRVEGLRGKPSDRKLVVARSLEKRSYWRRSLRAPSCRCTTLHGENLENCTACPVTVPTSNASLLDTTEHRRTDEHIVRQIFVCIVVAVLGNHAADGHVWVHNKLARSCEAAQRTLECDEKANDRSLALGVHNLAHIADAHPSNLQLICASRQGPGK